MENLIIEVGKYYKLKDGRKARVYATDGYYGKQIHGAIYYFNDGWSFAIWDEQGKFHRTCDSQLDIVSEWVEPHPAENWEVDKKIWVSDNNYTWKKAHFAKYLNGVILAWEDGKTSWTDNWSEIADRKIEWKYAKPAEEE